MWLMGFFTAGSVRGRICHPSCCGQLNFSNAIAEAGSEMTKLQAQFPLKQVSLTYDNMLACMQWPSALQEWNMAGELLTAALETRL